MMRHEAALRKFQFLLLAGIFMAQALGKARLSSLLFTLTFPVTLGVWLMAASRRISLCNALTILILAASGLGVAVNALVTNTLVSFSYVRKLVMFWFTVLLFGAMGECRPEKRDIKFVFLGNTAMACFLLLLYLAKRQEMYRINGIVTIYLTFRFTNPNLAAAFLAAAAMIEGIQTAASKTKGERCFHFLLTGILAFFVQQTRSRNAQLVLGLFLVVWLALLMFPGIRPKMSGWMAALIAVLPLLFALGYLLLVYDPGVQKLFSFLRSEGKDLDSRVRIWRFALEAFLYSPVFGAYSQISGGTGVSQMHNSHLDILASFGAPVLAMVCLLLFLLLYGKERDQCRFLCRLAFGAMILLGIGEAMLFSGGMGIYIYPGMMRMLANYDFAGKEGPV